MDPGVPGPTPSPLPPQVWLFGGSLVLSGLNARWLAPATARATAQLQALERERGLGAEAARGPRAAAYEELRAADPRYAQLRRAFAAAHGLSALGNLGALLCNGAALLIAARRGA